MGQRQPTTAVVDKLLGIFVAGAGLKRPLEIPQRRPLLIQIVIGIGRAEIPAVVPLKIVFMGQQQLQSLFVKLPVLQPGQIIVGAGQFTVGLRRPLLIGQRFDRFNDLRVFVVLVPDLALFQDIHAHSPLLFFPPAPVSPG